MQYHRVNAQLYHENVNTAWTHTHLEAPFDQSVHETSVLGELKTFRL